jgi:carbon-monoxide dehydrogenase medium subunit
MINSHILPDKFEYFEPRTIEEALHALATCREGAKVIAGGTDLLVQMKMGKAHPKCLVNISRVPALRYLIEERGLRIGTLTSFREIEGSMAIREKYTAFHEAAFSVTSVQIKHMGTIGGNLCHASPAADSAPPLIAFDARVKLVDGSRERGLSLEDFFTGPGSTVLSPSELLIEIQVPEPSGKVGSSFIKVARVSADLAKISVAVVIVRDGDVCSDCRIALGAVSKTPMRARKSEDLLRGKRFEASLVERAARKVSEEIHPITDVRSTDWYRSEMSKSITKNAIEAAWKRAS